MCKITICDFETSATVKRLVDLTTLPRTTNSCVLPPRATWGALSVSTCDHSAGTWTSALCRTQTWRASRYCCTSRRRVGSPDTRNVHTCRTPSSGGTSSRGGRHTWCDRWRTHTGRGFRTRRSTLQHGIEQQVRENRSQTVQHTVSRGESNTWSVKFKFRWIGLYVSLL